MSSIVSNNTNIVLLADTSTNVIVRSDTSNVVAYVQESYTPVSVGIQGPQGPPGVSAEDEIMYSKRIDFISDNELYKGEAPVGSSIASNSWRIRRITIVNSDITEEWASGTASFDKRWSDRLSYSYF